MALGGIVKLSLKSKDDFIRQWDADPRIFCHHIEVLCDAVSCKDVQVILVFEEVHVKSTRNSGLMLTVYHPCH